MHFIDECSVDRTSGNRTYGHSISNLQLKYVVTVQMENLPLI